MVSHSVGRPATVEELMSTLGFPILEAAVVRDGDIEGAKVVQEPMQAQPGYRLLLDSFHLLLVQVGLRDAPLKPCNLAPGHLHPG